MARIRTIKPDFWKHELISELSAEGCLLAIGILNYADDEGYFNANPKLIEAELFPLRKLKTSIQVLLEELTKINYISLAGTPDGRTYGVVNTFLEHQVINRSKPSKIKGLVQFSEQSLTNHGLITDESLLEGKGKEGNREGDSQPIDSAKVISTYCSLLDKKVLSVSKERTRAISQFLKTYTLEQWVQAMQKVKNSDWMQNEWTAWDIDWLLNLKNFEKVMQGNYDSKKHSKTTAPEQKRKNINIMDIR